MCYLYRRTGLQPKTDRPYSAMHIEISSEFRNEPLAGEPIDHKWSTVQASIAEKKKPPITAGCIE